ncbi:uncharacterized protein LOC142174546 [Nicotiana tabacum]|uniref:Uncharacterized protein LOC142174546 n=1 Tax=Nicotiana tabacum TaxID=4097 RepID=A0AC58TGY3_TOBAC
MRNATGFLNKEFPFVYLGCPIFVGRKRIVYFDGLVSKISKRLNGWQGKILSHGVKLTLVEHTLQAIPTCILAAMNPPKATYKTLKRYFANFFWGATNDKSKYHWSSWGNLCYPKEDRGGWNWHQMSARHWRHITIKRWWNFRTQQNLWTNFLRAKYCSRGHPVVFKGATKQSHIWRDMMKIRGKAETNICWMINRGDCSFWWDN